MVILRAEKPNPDGLDEVFHAYHTLQAVLSHADLCPNPTQRYEEEAAQSAVDHTSSCVTEALNMLGHTPWVCRWLEERSVEALEVSE